MLAPQFNVGDFGYNHFPAFAARDFARVMLAVLTDLNVDYCVYIGAHAGYWISPLRNQVPTMSFLCFEGNPVVYSRYEKELNSIPNVRYIKAVVSNDGGPVDFYIPNRLPKHQNLLHKLDKLLFRKFHKDFFRERCSWETEASLVPNSYHENYLKLEVDASLSFKDLTRLIPNEEKRKILLTDLEGYDFALLIANDNHIENFSAICFEYHFHDDKTRLDQLHFITSSLMVFGFTLFAIGSDENNTPNINLLFYNINTNNSLNTEYILQKAANLKIIEFKYTPSIASRIKEGGIKSIFLRFLSLLGINVFKSN